MLCLSSSMTECLSPSGKNMYHPAARLPQCHWGWGGWQLRAVVWAQVCCTACVSSAPHCCLCSFTLTSSSLLSAPRTALCAAPHFHGYNGKLIFQFQALALIVGSTTLSEGNLPRNLPGKMCKCSWPRSGKVQFSLYGSDRSRGQSTIRNIFLMHAELSSGSSYLW